MLNEPPGNPVEARIRTLRTELLAVADTTPPCTDCEDTACTHAVTLFSGGTDIPQVRDL
ncbi:hypothetical protein [Streptomyces sp. NPDC046979]|uniref:hypothetical protein n=1 Tax=Streptomyces sp. NPDC046979 TaxID=3154604 RepID=UPI0033C8B993